MVLKYVSHAQIVFPRFVLMLAKQLCTSTEPGIMAGRGLEVDPSQGPHHCKNARGACRWSRFRMYT